MQNQHDFTRWNATILSDPAYLPLANEWCWYGMLLPFCIVKKGCKVNCSVLWKWSSTINWLHKCDHSIPCNSQLGINAYQLMIGIGMCDWLLILIDCRGNRSTPVQEWQLWRSLWWLHLFPTSEMQPVDTLQHSDIRNCQVTNCTFRCL